MAFFYTGIHSLKGVLTLACGLSIAVWASGQADEAQPFSIDQITGTEQQAGLPLSDEELRKILELYEGSWRGSIDLTDKFGTVLQTLPVESEYRLENSGGKVVLLGRFQFGRDKNAKYSSSEVQISNGFLINRINQEGKNTVYRGEIEDGKIAWREYGVPRSEYNVFYESFDERNDRRICTTQSRNLRRDRDGTEKTYFTAGRYIYTGPLEKWTLPAPSFKDAAAEIPGAASAPDQVATGEGSTSGGSSISTVGEMSRRRAEGVAAAELPADLKVAQAEIASLRDQLEAEQAASTKLRARIAELERQVAQLKGEPLPETDATSAPTAEAESGASASAPSAPASEPEEEDSGRSTFRSRVR